MAAGFVVLVMIVGVFSAGPAIAQAVRAALVASVRFFLILAIATGHLLRPQQPMFRVFSTHDGLVGNWVTKIHRDSRGCLWFCTVEGISLFDGYRLTKCPPGRATHTPLASRKSAIWR